MKLILSLLISFFFICLPLCSSFFYPSYSLSSSSSLSPSISSSYIRTSSPLFPSRLLTSSLHSKISDGYYKDIEGLGDGMRYNRLGDSDLFVSKVGLGIHLYIYIFIINFCSKYFFLFFLIFY